MGVKGIEMSLIYGKLHSKIVLLISEMSRDKSIPETLIQALVLVSIRSLCCHFS